MAIAPQEWNPATGSSHPPQQCRALSSYFPAAFHTRSVQAHGLRLHNSHVAQEPRTRPRPPVLNNEVHDVVQVGISHALEGGKVHHLVHKVGGPLWAWGTMVWVRVRLKVRVKGKGKSTISLEWR